MFKVFSKEVLNELKKKIDSTRKIPCVEPDDYKLHYEFKDAYDKLKEYSRTQNNLSDIYESFDNIMIWDILDRVDTDNLDLIVDIVDMMGRMMMGDLWDDDKLLSMSGLDRITEFLYYYRKSGSGKRRKIRTGIDKILIFLKSCMIYEKINMLKKGEDNVSENESKN